MREFKSFYKSASGGEGERCRYSTRLDTYGCGCQHDCSYCYAKSLLSFRGLWNNEDPAVADLNKIERKLKRIPKGTVLRLGGMTDCFQPAERKQHVTLETIKLLNKYGIGYLIVTKSDLVADDLYMDVLDKKLAHIQITVTCMNDEFYKKAAYEKAPLPSARIKAIRKLQDAGFDVAIRLSPLIEEYMDFDMLNGLGINKAVVEFLRVNHWIMKWFDLDFSRYTLSEGGYRHLPLDEKRRLLNKISIPSVTVCEDVTAHYEYWKKNVNPNPDDCCNLKIDVPGGAGEILAVNGQDNGGRVPDTKSGIQTRY
jgi:DNA repair photolyase